MDKKKQVDELLRKIDTELTKRGINLPPKSERRQKVSDALEGILDQADVAAELALFRGVFNKEFVPALSKLNTLDDVLRALKTLKSEVVTAVNGIDLNIPDKQKVEVTNPKDFPRPFIPDIVDLKQPKWLSAIFPRNFLSTIERRLDDLAKSFKSVKIDFPTDAADAIPVRLSNGENFYEALTQVFSSGGGGSVPKIAKQGQDYVPVISGLSLPAFDYVGLNINGATETYTFKASGTLVATVMIVYTDATRTDILTVTKT